MGIIGQRKSSNKQTQIGYDTLLPKVRKKPNTATHRLLCEQGGKWLGKHSQNILVPNCQTVAVELFTQVEPEMPDIIGWCGWCSVMIEVKVQRADYLKDHKKPFRKICTDGTGEFRYYLCPKGLIKETELPENWGLLYKTNRGIKIIKKAEQQSANLIAERNMLTSYIRNRM